MLNSRAQANGIPAVTRRFLRNVAGKGAASIQIVSIDYKPETRKAETAKRYPLPMKGILVAMTVMNWTFASSGKLAM